MSHTLALNGSYSYEFIQLLAMCTYVGLIANPELQVMLSARTEKEVCGVLMARIIANRPDFKSSKKV